MKILKSLPLLLGFWLGASSSLAAEMTVSFETSLLGYDTDYAIGLEPAWGWHNENSSGKFDLKVTIPVVAVIKDYARISGQFDSLNVYLPGISYADYSGETWPDILADPLYLFTWLKNLSWSMKNLKVAVSEEFYGLNSPVEGLVWHNPFFDPVTGVFNRYMAVDLFSGHFQTSSLTNPGLIYADYIFEFPGQEGDNRLRILPAAWANFENSTDPGYGGGVEISSPYIKSPQVWTGLEAASHLYSLGSTAPESLSYRFELSTRALLEPIGLKAGYIYKSQNHPYGPLLSPLWNSRSVADYGAASGNHGIIAGIVPGFVKLFEFSALAEVYPGTSTPVSLRLQIAHVWEDNRVHLAYIHEGIESWEEFLDHRNTDSFIEFYLGWNMIPGRLMISLRELLGFSEQGYLKTEFSLTSFFQ